MLDVVNAKKMLSCMLLIREFELACAEQYSAGLIRGFLHLYIGQEAIAVGIIENLLDGDSIFSTYREHGHALARGIPANKIMAELFGKVDGVCRGRGGSMHIFDREKRFFGGNAIVGAALPSSVGMGLAHKLKGDENISVCFFGEGAVAEGEFHESMNLAALWNSPVLFICENNLYAMGTAFDRSEAQRDLVFKAKSYGVEADSIDGMDLVEVLRAASKATDYVRSRKAPFFLECRTYRYRAHSMYDPELYRDKDEVDKWKRRDPIESFKAHVENLGLLDNDIILNLIADCQNQVLSAVSFSKDALSEESVDLHKFIYAEYE